MTRSRLKECLLTMFAIVGWYCLSECFILPGIKQIHQHQTDKKPSSFATSTWWKQKCVSIGINKIHPNVKIYLTWGFFSQDHCLVVLEIESKHHHHPQKRPLSWACITPAPAFTVSASSSSAYLQIRSLQSTVHVLFPREWQLSLLCTGHVVHTSRYNTSQGAEEEVRNEKSLLLVSFLILQVAESAPDSTERSPNCSPESFIADSWFTALLCHF